MTDSTNEVRTPTAVDAIAEQWIDTELDLFPEIASIWPPGPRRRVRRLLAGRRGSGHRRDARRRSASDPRSNARRRRRPRHEDGPGRELELDHRQARGGLRPARPQRHRLARSGTARHLRPDADRDGGRLGNDRRAPAQPPGAMDGYIETLRSGIADGNVPAAPAGQRGHHPGAASTSPTPASSSSSRRRAKAGDAELPDSLKRDLADGAREAAAAYAQLAAFLGDELAPHAPREGRRRPRALRAGSPRTSSAPTVDLDETYEWGIEELARMVSRAGSHRRARSSPGASVARGDRVPRARPQPQAARHRRAAALDAGDQRPRRRRARRRPTSTSPTRSAARVHDRADAGRRHLLHRPDATTSPAPAACGGACPRASPSSTPGAS